MPTSIRPATADDLSAILEIYNDAVLHTTASYDYEAVSLESRQVWFAAKQVGNWPVFVAVNEASTVIGFSTYGPFRAWRGYLYTAEHSVYVSESARGGGVGRALVEPLIVHAKERGLHVLLAGIDADNTASLRLHAKFGFEQVAHMKQVGRKFGRWLDLVFLQLTLDEGERSE